MSEDITVLVIRHPDWPTEIHATHDIQEVIFDLGASYDITRGDFYQEEIRDIQEDLARAWELLSKHMDTPLEQPLTSLIEQLTEALRRP